MLSVEGQVEHARKLRFEDLSSIASRYQVTDVSRLLPGRNGDAVKLAGILELVRPTSTAKYLGLHSSTDDFHASIPLSEVSDQALVLYRLDGQPLPEKSGGPVRFFIPDFAACHTEEIDECANVKFVDRIELTAEKGFDNRPHDGAEHEALHAKEQKGEREA
jgi:DMSO/TMAO reductase YedYZ molybdopterin-dependent catalytic subunit